MGSRAVLEGRTFLTGTPSGAGPIDPAHVACLREAGIPIVTGIREGLGAIDKLARWGGWRSNAVPETD